MSGYDYTVGMLAFAGWGGDPTLRSQRFELAGGWTYPGPTDVSIT